MLEVCVHNMYNSAGLILILSDKDRFLEQKTNCHIVTYQRYGMAIFFHRDMFIFIDNVNTKWYLHSHFVCVKLLLSILDTSCDFFGFWRTRFYFIIGGFLLKAKAYSLPRHSRGFIVLLKRQQKKLAVSSEFILNAGEGTRTPTPKALDPKSSASANSATPACCVFLIIS